MKVKWINFFRLCAIFHLTKQEYFVIIHFIKYEMGGESDMASKNTQGKSKLVLKSVLFIYIVELIWFFYSQIIAKLMNGQKIDLESKELGIILIIGLLAIIVFFVLKKSRKVGSILIGGLIVSVLLFCIIAPLFDVYIPMIWQLFHNIK